MSENAKCLFVGVTFTAYLDLFLSILNVERVFGLKYSNHGCNFSIYNSCSKINPCFSHSGQIYAKKNIFVSEYSQFIIIG